MNLGIRNQFVVIVLLTIFITATYFVSFNLRDGFNVPSKLSEFITWQSVVVSDSPPTNRNGNRTLNPSVQHHTVIEVYSRVFQRFINREQFLKKRCGLLNKTENYVYYDYFLNERMLYENYHDFFVCLVAKNAASTWRKHLENIGLKHKNESSEGLSKKEKGKIVLSGNTVKVLTVRNPIDRLISVYSDKFGGGREAPQSETKRQWYDFAEGALHLSLGGHRNRSISFSQYISVVTKEPANIDRHFRSVYSNCVPCKIDYDFIVHQETFSEDLVYLFHVLNITESTIDLRVNESRNRTIERKPSELYLKELKPEQLVAIYDLLWTDFFLFDYPVPDSILDALKQKGRDSFIY